MKGIREWLKNVSIKRKFVFYSYLILTPILMAISCLLFFYNYRRIVRMEEESNFQCINSLSDSIEVVQNSISELGSYICINEEINRILTNDSPKELNKNTQLWLQEAPLQMIQDMMALDGQIRTIAIYAENGVNSYLRCMDHSAYIADMDVIRRQNIYQLAAQNKGKFLWQRIGKYESDTYEMNRSDKIVMYRTIYDLAQKNKLGYLVIGASASKFDKICQNEISKNEEAIVVMTEYGAELVRCGQVEDDLIEEIKKNSLEPIVRKGESSKFVFQDYSIYMGRGENNNTIVYKIVPRVAIKDYMNTIFVTPLILLFGVLIGWYPITLFISKMVTRPLMELSAAMDNFKRGNFNQKMEVTTQDEIGKVTACFNSMVDDIRDLIDKNYVMALKEKESELDALQAQINPHFLYNTLDSLYWKANEAGSEELAEDIISLSDLFRLVLNRGNGIVTVRTEIELLERYLHIQKMRFGKRLNYEFFVDNSIYDEEIPKLILQPFVENAIVHGFEKGDKEYQLSIVGKRESTHMLFEVIDTGVGMSEEQLNAIWEIPDTRQYASQRIGRYAMKNIKERLELIYKSEYELIVESKEGHGTTVRLLIPYGIRG